MWGGDGLEKDDSGEPWLGSGYTWKVETIRFFDRLDVSHSGGG